MVRPQRTAVFLSRPMSAAAWDAESVSFLVRRRGSGTADLTALGAGEPAELTGPLGGTWNAVCAEGRLGLVSGGLGIAPIAAFARELAAQARGFDLYAGFASQAFGLEGLEDRSVIIATEDGSAGRRGRIPDFFEPSRYQAVYACGPEGMLKAIARMCGAQHVSCFLSLERRMACGVGACLGCTVATTRGNRRCCTDGPIFNAQEVIFDD